MSPVFVICTGRCGSTFVSKLLRAHPQILSLSTFFSATIGRAFPDAELTGTEFWGVLSGRNRPTEDLLRKGARVPEILYPYQSGGFNLRTGIPSILYFALPLLTDDPDGLYWELDLVVKWWPRRPVADHYRELFRWLANRFSKPAVVERSGQSITWIPQLRAMFPEAKFVHLYRNGPDCAVSMSTSPIFRLFAFRSEAARLTGLPWGAPLDDHHLSLLPDHLARVASGDYDLSSLMSDDIPITWFGRMWATQVSTGVGELAKLPSAMRMSTNYDTLLSNPVPELTRLARFAGVEPTDEWLRHAAGRVDPSRSGASHGLDPATLAQLEKACAPGIDALQWASRLDGAEPLQAPRAPVGAHQRSS